MKESIAKMLMWAAEKISPKAYGSLKDEVNRDERKTGLTIHITKKDIKNFNIENGCHSLREAKRMIIEDSKALIKKRIFENIQHADLIEFEVSHGLDGSVRVQGELYLSVPI